VCPAVRELKIPIIADSWSAQAEEILSARPDLVIASVPYQPAALAEILKSGARFVGLAPKTFSDVLGDIAVIARIMGVERAGQQVIAKMNEQVEDVRQKAASAQSRPRSVRHPMLTRMVLPAGLYLTALESRFSITRSRRCASQTPNSSASVASTMHSCEGAASRFASTSALAIAKVRRRS